MKYSLFLIVVLACGDKDPTGPACSPNEPGCYCADWSREQVGVIADPTGGGTPIFKDVCKRWERR